MKGLRRAFQQHIVPALVAVLRRLRFLDETGVHLGMTRLYGRESLGERVPESTPSYSSPHYTVLATLSVRGVEASWFLEGALHGAAWRAYVEGTCLAFNAMPVWFRQASKRWKKSGDCRYPACGAGGKV